MKLIERILLAHDFSESSENVVITAIEFSKIFQTEVVPIHVLPDDINNEKVKALLHQTASQKLEETVERLQNEGVKTATPILAYGSPHRVIVEAAVDTGASFILTGSGETQKCEKFLLRTTAERIIQGSEKPVFVVKEGQPLNVQHILCPVDFSPTSKRALRNAITMAHRFKAELTVLSICERQGFTWLKAEESDSEYEERFKAYKEQFDTFLADFNLAGLKWYQESRKGKPAEEILNTITGSMVDLLVMGTAGKTNLSRLVIGSVTEKVTREVPCSFLTLKSEDIITLQLTTNIRDIENHYKTAMQLMEDGFYEQAIDQLRLCLSINNMHMPSHLGMAKVYDKLNMPARAEVYRVSGRKILDRMWNQKIEEEVRKLRSS